MARRDEAGFTSAPHPLVALAVTAVYLVVIGYAVALVARAVQAQLAQKPQGRLGMVSGVLGRLAKRRAGR
jgi:hypothetical protein